MMTIHPQYIKDSEGKESHVVLPVSEFEQILEQLDELEDIRLFDEAKKEDTGEQILFSDFLAKRRAKNA